MLNGRKSYIGGMALAIGQALRAVPEPVCQTLAIVADVIAAFFLPVGIAHKIEKAGRR